MKYRKLTMILTGLLIAGSVLTCTEEEDMMNCSCNIIQVKYGNFFNMCNGYCRKDIVLKPRIATFTQQGYSGNPAAVTCSGTLADSTWKALQTDMDVRYFFNLPATIGCPDCADGGAEWIELELKDGSKHKIVFEYGKEPIVLKDYAAILRNLMTISKQDCQ